MYLIFQLLHWYLVSEDSIKMGDVGFPGQHTTTTTVQTSNTTVQTSVRFDPLYIRTIPGMIKIAVIVSITIILVLIC